MQASYTYPEAVRFLLDLPYFTNKNEPGNTVRLMELLGHPERSFRVIHVAGTNGKGSTCAFLERIFRENGCRTGLFTSPHLVRINERMRIEGREIADQDFADAFSRVRGAVLTLLETGGREPTFFEHLFAMGMCWFQEKEIDLLICETGLGGRLDVTNTIEIAQAEVITSIGLDHTEYLGGTVEQIAFEKAGIIRPQVPCIYSAKDPAAARVIGKRCREVQARPFPLKAGRYTVLRRDEASIRIRLQLPEEPGLDREHIEFTVPFAAGYQAENASLAALCALVLGVKEDVVCSGIADTRWPGRMEEIRKDVILDGAHNPDGIREIAREIRRAAADRKVHLLTAVVSDKNHDAMVRELCRDVRYEHVTVTQAGGGRKLDPEILAREFRLAGQVSVETEPDVKKAYCRAIEKREDGVLFCVGSLYLIGEIERYIC